MSGDRPIVMDLTLLNGTPKGVIRLMLRNREGIVFKIPRNYANQLTQLLSKTGSITCLDKSCVYILFGLDDLGKQPMAYIGETDTIATRLLNHCYNQKSFWNSALVFCRNDYDFGKEAVYYIETQLIDRAVKVKQYRIDNAVKTQYPAINDSNRIVADDFIENIFILTETLGYSIFEAKSTIEVSMTQDGVPFFVIVRNNIIAKGQPVGDGKKFVVFKGSTICPEVAQSLLPAIKNNRENLIARGAIVNNQFTEDVLFTASSTAAGVVCGCTISGPEAWNIPLPDGSYKTLKRYREEQGDLETN
jgi:hypothetical protein